MASTQASNRVQRSNQAYQRALELIPGGTQLISRRPTRFANGISPAYAKRGRGPRFWDIDDNEYIDWVSGIGAIILGYGDPQVDDAARDVIESGFGFSINHPLELELAEELVNRIPCAEMVRFCKGGGEACAIAVRIARGATGRDKVLFCGYHGWHDWYLAANLGHNAALDEHLFSGIEPIGVPQTLEGSAIPFAYGELDSLGQLLDDHRGQIAAIIMEPMRSELPPENYLQGVSRLAQEHDVVLIFDEVSTGFRPSAQGSQTVVGVTPDLAVFAKSISNGYPMGAVVGRRDVMNAAANMFISSTYWSDPIGMAASLATLRQVEERDVPRHVAEVGTTLKTQLTNVAEEVGLAATCCGVDYHPHLEFAIEDPVEKSKVVTLYIQEMAKRGCHGYASFYTNASQGKTEITQTVDAARETFQLIAEGLNEGRLDKLVECRPQEEIFNRLVR